MKKTAIYGGSFDPPHKGHTEIIRRLSEMFDRVIVLPAYISPFKQGINQVPSEDRLTMLRLAIKGLEIPKNNVEISSYEIEKGGVSFTCDTIAYLKSQSIVAEDQIGFNRINNKSNSIQPHPIQNENQYGENLKPQNHCSIGKRDSDKKNPNHCDSSGFSQNQNQSQTQSTQNKGQDESEQLYFVTGSESVPTLHLWKNSAQLKNEVTFYIVPREGYPPQTRPDFRLEIAPFCIKDYSSSLFKAAHAFGFSQDLVGEKVFDYIKSKGFYEDYSPLTRGFGDFSLSEGRIKHTYRAIKAGIVLAKIHGEPVDKAITALTLHDIAKNTTPAAMLACGVSPSNVEGLPKDCRHAVWGADIARQYYKIVDEDILNAIRFHTTGRPCMSRLEMIVALADYVEEGREFVGREAVFCAAKSDLSRAMADMLTRVVDYLGHTNREVFGISRQALEYYKNKK